MSEAVEPRVTRRGRCQQHIVPSRDTIMLRSAPRSHISDVTFARDCLLSDSVGPGLTFQADHCPFPLPSLLVSFFTSVGQWSSSCPSPCRLVSFTFGHGLGRHSFPEQVTRSDHVPSSQLTLFDFLSQFRVGRFSL
jgi:hypothetical protein